MSNPTGINQYTKGVRSTAKKPPRVSQATVNATKGNHKPGWMLRADPYLAALVKGTRALQRAR